MGVRGYVESMCTGMRGLASAEVTLTGPARDLQSGTREGGSGPEADLAEILGAPLVLVAVGLDSDQAHAPNEKVGLSLVLRGASLLLRGAEVSAYLWEELASTGADLK